MNRLTDALYMVRFKVSRGVCSPDPSSLVGGRKRVEQRVGPSTALI